MGGLEAADERGYREIEPATGKLIVRDKDKGRWWPRLRTRCSRREGPTRCWWWDYHGLPKAEVIVIEDGPEPTLTGSAARPAMPPS